MSSAQKYTIDADIKGAVVTEVTADSAAADKRLEPGDVITEAGEKAVTGAADISASIDEAEKAGKNSVLLLVVKRRQAGRDALHRAEAEEVIRPLRERSPIIVIPAKAGISAAVALLMRHEIPAFAAMRGEDVR